MSLRRLLQCLGMSALIAAGCFIKPPPYQGPVADWVLVEARAKGELPEGPRLSWRDYEELKAVVPSLQAAIPERIGELSVTVGEAEQAVSVRLSGTTADMFRLLKEDVWGEIVSGRFLEDGEAEIVVTEEAAKELFGSVEAVGQTIVAGERPLTVVGVIRQRHVSQTGEVDQNAFVSLETFDSVVAEGEPQENRRLDRIWLQVASLHEVVKSQRVVEKVLRKHHRDDGIAVRVGLSRDR